ncbi:MAG: SDR family oxidoreductase [Phycisphaerae bacterium]|nr:SDR family oxidoreductase [Gemmatimonadaceae bacterium]
MPLSADQRVTLVTGGARRVGAAIVRAFARRGDAIVLHHGSSPDDARQLADELRTAGTLVHVIAADLRDATAAARVVDEAMQTYGQLDVVVSSASVMLNQPFDAVTAEEWDAVSAVNLRAPFFLSQAAARVMKPGGSIIHMCDHLANEARFPHLIAHQATKAGVANLVATLAGTLAPRIRVNGVAPGLVLKPTEMSDERLAAFLRDVPMARSGTPDDVVQAIMFLVEATYVTGTVLQVDGGRHLWR